MQRRGQIMEPMEAIDRAEDIFDEMVARVIGLFGQFGDEGISPTWEEVLSFLREVASVVARGSSRLAAYSGVAARQIKRGGGE